MPFCSVSLLLICTWSLSWLIGLFDLDFKGINNRDKNNRNYRVISISYVKVMIVRVGWSKTTVKF